MARDLAESAARRLGRELVNRVRQALEDALDEYIRNYQVETFSRDFTSGKCTMTMRVIWNKGKGRFNYVILGNCNCSKVSARGSHKVLLERWSVTGSGSARWVGEKKEKANKNTSSVKGTVRAGRVRVKSVCCGKDGSVCALPPSKDPWVFTPRAPPNDQQQEPKAANQSVQLQAQVQVVRKVEQLLAGHHR